MFRNAVLLIRNVILRIRIQPHIFRVPDPYNLGIFGNLKKNVKFNHREESTNYLLQSYSTHSPEFTGIKFEIKFLFICGYIFFWIRIQEKVPDPASSGPTTVQKYQAFFPTEKGKCLCRTALYSDRNKQFPA